MPNLSCFSGFLSDVKGIAVTSVALGKAHGVLLTNKGQVYTFGLNNKGQCGREFVAGGSSKERKYFFYINADYFCVVCLSVITSRSLKWKIENYAMHSNVVPFQNYLLQK